MGDCLLRKCVVRGEKHGTSMFTRSDDLSYLFTRWLNLVGIYIMNINLEINFKKTNVERGNFVFQIEGLKQYRSCPLPGHSSVMNPTPIPARLFQVFDEVGKSVLLYRPGTRWCTSCRRNADKKFPSMAKY